MRHRRLLVWAVAAAVIIAGAAAPTTPADARAHRMSHPPIHVATPTGGSVITPYFFPYGGRHRYNSPGPVYSRLDDWGADASCRLWRYNYLYWVC